MRNCRFYNHAADFTSENLKWRHVLDSMNQAQKRRGPDDEGTYLKPQCGLAHVRLKIIDLVTGQQPMVRKSAGRECAIVFNGEIYNMKELEAGASVGGNYLPYHQRHGGHSGGIYAPRKGIYQKLNGIFAIALWDSVSGCLHLFRDRLGVKPLFYTIKDGTLVFSSEIKGLLAYPGITPVLDRDGLCEIFALGPAKSYGKGVFRDILEILPGHCLTACQNTFSEEAYWEAGEPPPRGFHGGDHRKDRMAGGGCREKADALRHPHQYLSLRRRGQQSRHLHLCQRTEKAGQGAEYLFL